MIPTAVRERERLPATTWILQCFAIVVVAGGLLATQPLAAQDPAADGIELYLTLSPSVISVDETADLVLEARGKGFSRFQAEPDFVLENLTVVSGPHRTNSFNYVNGVSSRSVKYTWEVRPSEVGTGVVSGVTVKVQGKLYQLPDRTVTVQTEPTGRAAAPTRPRDPIDEFFNRRAPRRRTQRAEPEIFLRAEATPSKPYVGQQVRYTIYLFSQTDITSTEAESLPDFKGLWVHDVPQPRELRSEIVELNGKTYGRVALMQKILFPLRAETIELDPAGFRLLARVPDRGFFGPVMGRSEPTRRRSNRVTIDVQPLPDSPAGFQGAVGDLELEAELTPAEIEEGEAATLVVRLSGEGHIQGLPAPELPELDGIRVYPPQQSSHSEVRSRRLVGERSWSYVLIPERPGEWELPALDLDYFDPRRGEYRKTETRPLALSVAPGAARSDAVDVVAELEEPADAPTADEAGRWRAIALTTIGLFGLLVVGLLGAWIWKRRGAGSDSEKRLRAALDAIPHGAKPRRVAASLEEAWRDFLSERWNISPGQPSPQWGRLLEEQGADPEVAGRLVTLADDLHYLRYAPQLSSTDELRRDLVERSLRLARALR